jgi:hypothetical protein
MVRCPRGNSNGSPREEKVTYRRWGAVTAVTKLKRGQRLRLLAIFAFGNRTNILIRRLLTMKVIALARWTLWPDERHPTYLLFETNWSGADQTYIPDFGRLMPLQWRGIWGATTQFPGAIPTTGLMAWVDVIDAGVGHFWTDYDPGASTQVITQALELESVVNRFVTDTEGVSATEFDRRWRDLVLKGHRLV